MTSQPILHNIRILDFSWVLAGPYATRTLADFGAEVIKVESLLPRETDEFARGYYNTWNRNKLGITLDLNKPEGIALAKKLAGISDAVVENFSPRVMANWGLDYASLRKIKPDIIMLSISLMGNSGPWRDYSGFGPTVQAFSGMTGLTAYEGREPTGLGFAYADHIAAQTATLALLSALEYRRQTGEGQYIDISQVEAMTSLLSDAFIDYPDKRPGEAAPYGIYRCRGDDRWCAISVRNDKEWAGFCRALDNPPWAKNRKFATLPARLKNTAELDRLVEEWTEKRSAEEVMTWLQGQGVAAGVVQDARDLADDPQLRARGFFIELERPETGQTISDATPVKLSENPTRYRCPAPLPGQDNDYVYGQLLGISPKEIAELRKQGII